MAPKSTNFKFGRVNILPEPRLLHARETAGEEALRTVVLECPKIIDDSVTPPGTLAAIIGAEERHDDPHIIQGFMVQQGDMAWPHLEGAAIVEDMLKSHPYCRFYLFVDKQIIAMQSSRISKSLRRALGLFDHIIAPRMADYQYATVSAPLLDARDFREALQRSERVLTVKFRMLPPNSYRRRRAREVAEWLTKESNIAEFGIAFDSKKKGSVNPKAPAIEELISECEDGNGDAFAFAFFPGETAPKHITTKGAEVAHTIEHKTADERGAQYLREVLRRAQERSDQ